VAILKQRIYSKRLPPSFNLLDHSIDNIEKMLSQQTILDQHKRATFSNEHLKMIAKYKYDIMTLTIRIAEEIVQRHTEIIVNEKKKLIDHTDKQVSLPKTLISIINAISKRQSNIIQRAQIITKQKISFFEYAPMVVDKAGTTIGAML